MPLFRLAVNLYLNSLVVVGERHVTLGSATSLLAPLHGAPLQQWPDITTPYPYVQAVEKAVRKPKCARLACLSRKGARNAKLVRIPLPCAQLPRGRVREGARNRAIRHHSPAGDINRRLIGFGCRDCRSDHESHRWTNRTNPGSTPTLRITR